MLISLINREPYIRVSDKVSFKRVRYLSGLDTLLTFEYLISKLFNQISIMYYIIPLYNRIRVFQLSSRLSFLYPQSTDRLAI